MKPISVFDAHCDTISRCYYLHEGLRCNTGDLSLEKTERFARYCQFFALWTTKEYTDGDGCTMEEAYHTLLGCFRAQMACNSDKIIQCRTAQDVEQAHRCGKAAAFLTVEGAELLGCDPARLDQAAIDGVTAINLTWNYANALSGSSKEQPERGLSTVGRDFVRKMEDLRILVDVSHLSDAGFYDVLQVTGKPFVASHSNARAVCPSVRNMTDDMIRKLSGRGGVMGLNFCADFLEEKPLGEKNPGTIAAVVRHARHIADVGGIEVLGLGSDFDGIDTHQELPGVQGMERLWDGLHQAGFSQDALDRIFYGNVLRVYRETLG